MKIQEAKEILNRNGIEFEEVPGGISWRPDGLVIEKEDWNSLVNGGLQWWGRVNPNTMEQFVVIKEKI